MDDLLTTEDLAGWLRVPPTSVTAAVRRKQLVGVKIGREYRYTVQAVVAAWPRFAGVTAAEIRAAAEREADQSSDRSVS